jgi:spermidine synthase
MLEDKTRNRSAAPPDARRDISPVVFLLLVFGSGYCSLIYQTVWLREFRLLFGSSTPATAAVLAVFMGGLGVGSLLFASASQRWKNPARAYGLFELIIALCAACSPFTLGFARDLYVSMGGSFGLGIVRGTALRIALAIGVIAPAAICMGATLPAIARAGASAADPRRGGISLLYMFNTAGAMTAVVLATFLLFERFGLRVSLWSACVLNAAIALAAITLARGRVCPSPAPAREAPVTGSSAGLSTGLICLVAGISGFLFFLMEIVWYRMLSALLGGSTYTFGVILSVALLGIAAGSGAYRAVARRVLHPVPLLGFVCAALALALIGPYALGDRLALLVNQFHSADSPAFGAVVFGWYLAAGIVVLPASIVAGFQLPLLIALMGTGTREAGRDTGWIYAANTAGSILGSLCGGFGLLPAFGAPSLWKYAAFTVVAVSVLVACASLQRAPDRKAARQWALLSALTVLLAVRMAFALGPTAAWRHSGIVTGRHRLDTSNPNAVRAAVHKWNSSVIWEQDGWESAVANMDIDSFSFVVNGKSDGSSRSDAGTQVMSGLIGAALTPNPRDVLVVGLGTGCTAGWIAALDEVRRVDVVELEEAVVRFAKDCTPANEHVLDNPKVHVHIGDAREYLITRGSSYDLIVSEPSNPYRAGVATLFSRECYRSVRSRLNKDGIFVQWMQGYETDMSAVISVLATLRSEFEHVEIWTTLLGDFVLVAGEQSPSISPSVLKARVESPVFRRAMNAGWGEEGLEAFFAHFVANGQFTSQVAALGEDRINTDDRLILEYIYARSIHAASNPFQLRAVLFDSGRIGTDRPEYARDTLDWNLVKKYRATMAVGRHYLWPPELSETFLDAKHAAAINDAVRQDWTALMARWGEWQPVTHTEKRLLATAAAVNRHPSAGALIEALPAQARFIRTVLSAQLAVNEERGGEAVRLLVDAFQTAQKDPWTDAAVHADALKLAARVAVAHPEHAAQLHKVLESPFPLGLNEQLRLRCAIIVASQVPEDGAARAARIHLSMEPWVFWDQDMLESRMWAYRKTGHPLEATARLELMDFIEETRRRSAVAVKDDRPSIAGNSAEKN